MAANAPFTSLRLVQLDHLIANLTEEAYKDLQNIAASLPGQADENKKRALLQHLNATKQRLHRLQILLQWCHKSPAVAECKRVLEVSSTHADAFRDAADQLAYLHGELIYSKAPPYDVPTAMHVLRHGGFSALPTLIESEFKFAGAGKSSGSGNAQQRAEDAATGAAALRRLDFLMRAKFLEEGLPQGMRVERVKNGEAVLSSTSRQYTATVSLVPAPSDDVILARWGPAPGSNTTTAPVEEPEVAQRIEKEPAEQEGKSGMPDSGGGGEEKVKISTTGAAAAAGVAGEALEMEIDDPSKQAIHGMDDTLTEPSTSEKLSSSSEASQWRWRVLSFQVLPNQSEAVLPPHLIPWVLRNLEDRMWAATDIQRLLQLGKGEYAVVPPPPMTRRERDKRQREVDAAGRAGTLGRGGGELSSFPGQTGSGTADKERMSQSVLSAPHIGTASGGTGTNTNTVTGGGGGDGKSASGKAGTPGVIPDWARAPLAALHAVLQHLSAKLALGSVLMEQMKRLEAGPGPWAGGVKLKVGKLADGFGVRLALWPHVPLLSINEVSALKDSAHKVDIAAAIGGGGGTTSGTAPGSGSGDVPTPQQGAERKEEKEESGAKPPALGFALEVQVVENGVIQCISAPSLRQPETGAPVSLSPWTPSGAISGEHLLVAAGVHHADMQLAGVRALIAQQHAQQLDKILGVGWKVEVISNPNSAGSAERSRTSKGVREKASSGGGSASSSAAVPAVPSLQCSVRNEPAVLLHLDPSDGQPRLSLGFALLEADTVLATEARDIVTRAQILLLKRLEALLAAETLPQEGSKARVWAAAVATAVMDTWRQLASAKRKLEFEKEAITHRGFARVGLPRCLIGIQLCSDSTRETSSTTSTIADAAEGVKEESRSPSVAAPETTAVLRLCPSFPAPKLSSSSLGDIIPMGKQGSLVGSILADVGTAGAAGHRQLTLALCWATPRGIPTGLFRILPVPGEVIIGANKGNGGGGGGEGRPPSAKRKREEEEDNGLVAAAGASSEYFSSPSSNTSSSQIDWVRLRHWCLSATAAQQLQAQLEAAELIKPKDKTLLEKTGGVDSENGTSKAIRVVLAETWLSKEDGKSSLSDGHGVKTHFATGGNRFSEEEALVSFVPENPLQRKLDKNADVASLGTFSVRLTGPSFATWLEALQEQGVETNISFDSSASATFTASGIQIDASLAEGMSPVEVVVKAGCAPRTLACALLLVDAMKQQRHDEANGAAYAEISISSVDLDKISLKVDSSFFFLPGSKLDVGGQASAQRTGRGVVTIQWIKRRSSGTSGTAIGTVRGTGTASFSSQGRSLAPSGPGLARSNAAAAGAGGGFRVNSAAEVTRETVVGTMACRITAEPPLPRPLLAALESALQQGEESAFISALKFTATSAAALQARLLDPAAQKAAGLLPDAVIVEDCQFEIAPQHSTTAPSGGLDVDQAGDDVSHALGHCILLVRQLGRALQLGLWFQPSGGVTLRVRQLPPPPLQRVAQPANGAVVEVKQEPWLREVWEKVLEVAGVGGSEHERKKEANDWGYFCATLSANYLGMVLDRLLHAVSRKAYDTYRENCL